MLLIGHKNTARSHSVNFRYPLNLRKTALVSFFDRNRKDLEKRGINPSRLPPGQYFTDRFPVLHVGDVPTYSDLATYDVFVKGAVDRELRLTLAEIMDRPKVTVETDIHCVTKWSKFDTHWTGVSIAELLHEAGLKSDATHVMFHCEYGYTTNLPLADVLEPNIALLAYEFEGEPLEADHGFPLRSFVPHLYLWKSAKWIRGIEVLTEDRPGFWERNGYHMYGDPFREQRFWGS
jgi:DMSO/TMAO reductase YedYZ molybdopterin-dependent catalytic subunit